MKKITGIFLAIVLAVTLIACTDKKEVPLTPLEPGIPVEPITPEEPVEDEDVSKIVLVDELKTRGVSYNVNIEDVEEFKEMRLELFMGGSYDNPIAIQNMIINGDEVTLTIEGLPTKAGEHASGIFDLAGYKVELHRATNYEQLRIKSKPGEIGYLVLDLEGIVSIEFDLLFSTGAAGHFEKVEITLTK